MFVFNRAVSDTAEKSHISYMHWENSLNPEICRILKTDLNLTLALALFPAKETEALPPQSQNISELRQPQAHLYSKNGKGRLLSTHVTRNCRASEAGSSPPRRPRWGAPGRGGGRCALCAGQGESLAGGARGFRGGSHLAQPAPAPPASAPRGDSLPPSPRGPLPGQTAGKTVGCAASSNPQASEQLLGALRDSGPRHGGFRAPLGPGLLGRLHQLLAHPKGICPVG